MTKEKDKSLTIIELEDLHPENARDDDWDVFRVMKDHRRRRNGTRLEQFDGSPLQLMMRKHSEHHYSIPVQGKVVSYWPSTAKWKWNNDPHIMHGGYASFCGWLRKRGVVIPDTFTNTNTNSESPEGGSELT